MMEIENETLENASLLFKALSDPHRLAVVYYLSLNEMNVNTIANTLAMEQSAVSHQLKILKAARLVKSRREGKTRIYSIMDEHVYELIDQVVTHVQEKR
ncbi:MAG: metalloregulator ArsR/SmtB family transcription factor [Alkalibacterium sp.]